ncbi:MAG: hypothetical protein FJ276_09240 [Planctomycetes bacterium]|nr:hypothetical protein [Planctomycetota bacterium]
MISRFHVVLLASCVALPVVPALAQDQTLSTEQQAALAERDGSVSQQAAAQGTQSEARSRSLSQRRT